jgi:hypothetical protein
VHQVCFPLNPCEAEASPKSVHPLMMGPGFFFLGGLIFCFSSLINLFPLPLAQAKNAHQQFWK